jgi:NAD(P)-dependent dehydrogenase (short-subunit alcohol dehydrogenase family)
MGLSYVVTGGGRGIGRALVSRLLSDPETAAVVAVELDPAALDWVTDHRVGIVTGNAAEESVAERAADTAAAAGTLAGWVNNAALFRDASVDSAPTAEILELIATNLTPAVVGCAVAVRRFLAAGTPGAIVNVSSHQARQVVPGCTPYATAKAAVEGLTRALAVEYGPRGIRVNAVAPGTVVTERYEQALERLGSAAAERLDHEMRLLHPMGRLGRADEVAAAIAYLLSPDASFINGATVPVDGGRTVLTREPDPA